VALGVAVVISIDLAIQSSREAFRISTETLAGRATHRIVGNGGNLPDSLLTQVRKEWGLRPSAPVVEAYVASPLLPGRPLRVLGIDPFSEGPFRPFLLGESSELDVTLLLSHSRGVFVGEGTASEMGIAVGDSLPVQVDGRPRALHLQGILEPKDELSRRAVSHLLVMDLATAQELLNRGGLSHIDLIVPAGPDGEEKAGVLANRLGGEARLEAAGSRANDLAQMTRAFDLNLTALSLLALIFGMFLIYNTMTFSVVQRRPILAELRVLGVTRREISILVLGEAAALGAIGTGLGLALGVLLGRGLVKLITRTINDLYFVISVEGLSLPPEVFLKAGVLGVGATLLASLPPALEAGLSSPRSTLVRSVLEEKARRAVPRVAAVGVGFFLGGCGLLLIPSRSILLSFGGLFGVVMGIALLTPLTTALVMAAVAPWAGRAMGILGSMAARGVVAAMSRTAPAMAALVVAVSVTVGLGTMITSFRSTVSSWLDGTLQADIYVSLPGLVSSRAQGTLDPLLVDRLTSGPGVDGFSTYREAPGNPLGGAARLVALDLDLRGEAAFDFKAGGGREGFSRFRKEEGVFISEPLAYRRDLAVGNEIIIQTGVGERTFPVAGIFYDYGSDQGVVMMARDSYDRYWSDGGVTSLGLFTQEGVSLDATVKELQGRVGEGREVLIRSNRSLREASLAVFDRTFAITGVLRLLAFIVAFIGVLSALMALQLERSRELGVLRANGMTPGQVWHLVMTQTGLMGMVAGILAMPAGLALAVVMIFVVNKRSFGWTLQMELGPEILLQAVLLAFLGALLAGVYPAWRMSRTSPAEALRQE
jgi:putative ABC transport system permease protein